MNAHTTHATSLSRRNLLRGGALVIAFGLTNRSAQVLAAEDDPKPLDPTELDSWLAIDAKGKVTVFFGKCDMGQGSDVAMAQIVADELDVPFSAVIVVQGDSFLTVNQGDASGSFAVSLAEIGRAHV